MEQEENTTLVINEGEKSISEATGEGAGVARKLEFCEIDKEWGSRDIENGERGDTVKKIPKMKRSKRRYNEDRRRQREENTKKGVETLEELGEGE